MAYSIKIPLSLEDHAFETNSIEFKNNENTETHVQMMHKKMSQVLKPNEWIVYKGLYVEHLDEDVVAKKLGLKSNEKNRKPGYKQIKNLKKSILKKAKECIEKGEIELL